MKNQNKDLRKKYTGLSAAYVALIIAPMIFGCLRKTNEEKLFEYVINSKTHKINILEFKSDMEKIGAKISQDSIQSSISVTVGRCEYILNMWDSTEKISEILFKDSKSIYSWKWDTLGTRTKTKYPENIE